MKRNASEHPGSFWTTTPRPWDAKTWFNNLEEALSDILPVARYTGLKFTVKDDSANGHPGPREYWFKLDFKPPHPDDGSAWEANSDVTEENAFEFGDGLEGFPGWEWAGDKAIVPPAEVYLPADAEGYNDQELRTAISGNFDFITGVSGVVNSVSGSLSGLIYDNASGHVEFNSRIAKAHTRISNHINEDINDPTVDPHGIKTYIATELSNAISGIEDCDLTDIATHIGDTTGAPHNIPGQPFFIA